MVTEIKLNIVEKELIAVGASVAAGCRPCTVYHIKSARKAGADDTALRRAVDAALRIRQTATELMAALADEHLADGPCSDASGHAQSGPIEELISVAAAFSVNCVVSLDRHLADAKALSLSDAQLQYALNVARMVKTRAGKKTEDAAHRATLGEVRDAAVPQERDDCACGKATRYFTPKAPR